MSRADCAFDTQGNLLWSDAGQGRTAYAYDAEGRLTAAVYPDGGCLGLRYDAAGNLAERRSPGGARESFAYDEGGRITAARLAAGTTQTYAYDGAGRLAEARAPGCVTRYAYDADGRPLRHEQTIDGVSYLAEFAYNADGHLIGARAPGFDAWLRYAYDDQQRLVALGYDGAPDLIRLAYEPDSRRVAISYASGAAQFVELDDRFQVRRIRLEAAGAALLDIRYRAGQAGNITAIDDERYSYDERGRLIGHGPLLGERTTYRYDDAGNRLEQRRPGGATWTYRYDRGGRLACVERLGGAKTRYSYDGEGNLLARRDERGAWSYRYDAAGRLIRVERDRRLVAEYRYDHTGRRVLKRDGAGTVITHRDPWGNRLAETTADGATRVYLGPAGQHLACLVVRAGQVALYFLHPDHLGSVRAVTDARGQLVARQDFDPFGSPLPAATTDPGWTPVFAGHPFDPALGLYDCATRLYDPQIGRFISADSYTFAADDPRLLWVQAPAEARRTLRDRRLQAWQREGACRNRYVYALNNPLTYVDRDGHSAGLYFLYTLAALFWALPYTLVGFLFFEVFLNWLTFAWAWDWGKHSWEGHSSDRLSTWSWWVLGGVSGRLVIGGGAFTLGNFIIANADFMGRLDTTTQSFGIPTNHNDLVAGTNLLTQRDSIVEHELRHVNQYGWWGPFMMPWVLVLYFVFQNLILQLASAISKKDVYAHWGDIWKTLTGSWWQGVIAGVGVLLLPGAYWWDYICRGGYANSWFEQNAAQYSGAANSQNVRASSSADSVAPSGTAIVSVISDPNLVGALTLAVSTNASGAAAPANITPAAISNLRVFRYTAGATAGTDVLTAGDGSSTFTLEIKVA